MGWLGSLKRWLQQAAMLSSFIFQSVFHIAAALALEGQQRNI
jgi:hypothetical protein